MVLGNREKKKCIPPTNLFSCGDKTQLSGQMFSRVILIEPSSESFVSAYSPTHCARQADTLAVQYSLLCQVNPRLVFPFTVSSFLNA